MKLITILGPTCSGKSEIAVAVAQDLIEQKQTVWIVGCDSKQVYKYLNIGSAKVDGKWRKLDGKNTFVYNKIPHFLIDYVNPFENQTYSLDNYLKDFSKLFVNQEPDYVILVGGTGFYAKNIYAKDDFSTTKTEFITTQNEYKQELGKYTLDQLQKQYLAIEPKQNGYRQLNQSDFANKIRIISFLVQFKGINENWFTFINLPKFEYEYIFQIKTEKQILNEAISKKVLARFDNGFLKEVEELLQAGMSEDFLMKVGLDYRLALLYFKGFIDYDGLVKKSIQENQNYAKRQLTWLQKEPTILVQNHHEILDTVLAV